MEKDQDLEGPGFRGPEFRSEKALLESSPKASRNFKNFKNFNPKIGEHSKQNHPNHLPRS